MAKMKPDTKRTRTPTELDSVFFLKMVLYMVVGTQWLWLQQHGSGQSFPLPIGLLIGTLFALHDHFKIDRKIEFATLLIASLIGFIANVGMVILL